MPRKTAQDKEIVVSASATPRHKPATPRRRRTVAALPVETPAAPEMKTPVTAPAPTPEQIAQLAYSFWEARGYQGGSPEEDWLRAERELTAIE